MKSFKIKWFFGVVLSFVVFVSMPSYAETDSSTSLKAEQKKQSPDDIRKIRGEAQGYKKEDCVALTSACLVCPDASIVGPDLKELKQDARECLKKGRSKVLGLKSSELYFSKLKGVNCQSVSSLCAVCPDQKFVSPDSDRELDTDLYECVHGPRAKQFGPKK